MAALTGIFESWNRRKEQEKKEKKKEKKKWRCNYGTAGFCEIA